MSEDADFKPVPNDPPVVHPCGKPGYPPCDPEPGDAIRAAGDLNHAYRLTLVRWAVVNPDQAREWLRENALESLSGAS